MLCNRVMLQQIIIVSVIEEFVKSRLSLTGSMRVRWRRKGARDARVRQSRQGRQRGRTTI